MDEVGHPGSSLPGRGWWGRWREGGDSAMHCRRKRRSRQQAGEPGPWRRHAVLSENVSETVQGNWADPVASNVTGKR